MHCLWCDEEILPVVDWNTFLIPEPAVNLCSPCKAELDKLEGSLCMMCGRRTSFKVCPDCQHWESQPQWRGSLQKNHSVYVYNQRMQDMLAKWKYRGDYKLREAFQPDYYQRFHEVFSKTLRKQSILVPIPLSPARLYERGFNQAEALAELLETPIENALSRQYGEKQSKKSRKERLASKNPFAIKQSVFDKPAILIDDIYTTGTTLRHAARTLKEHRCPQVFAFTLARG
ncbi:ComF family protein [Sediminibacillus albus]|uniref:Competence protein ComFC n=1 Tax=Sediminibacillus albus TaxID=407036 RepID=A0A1G8YM17_9BACI|nr:ComF family protein [Sediminibacillus albus]SDK03808.1 competence protein ComFC [Sediminibacillus albus]